MNFDLIHLFFLIVKYNLPFTNKKSCVLEISQVFIDGGCVWQKFAQVLSMNDLSKLSERIRTQLGREYLDPYDREYALEHLTVKQLLEMLEYMGDDKDEN